MNPNNRQKNLANPRFAACGKAVRLLTISGRAAGRVPVSKSVSPVHLSAGRIVHGKLSSGSQKGTVILTRCEIFRGKVSPRQTQKPTALEPRTQLRQTYE
jgi:hypothetical protein